MSINLFPEDEIMNDDEEEAPVSIEEWLALCRNACEAQGEMNDPTTFTQIWEAMNHSTQEDFQSCIFDLFNLIAYLPEAQKTHAARTVPDSSDFDAFTAYVAQHEDLRYSRKQLVEAAGQLEWYVGRARRDGFLSAELFRVLDGWVEGLGEQQEGVLKAGRDENEALNGMLDRVKKRRNRGELGSDWIKGGVLGKGSYGEAVVFLRQGGDGTIVDRVVVKTCKADLLNTNIWDQDFRQPTEVTAMNRLKACRNADWVTKLRNWAIAGDKSQYKLYMELCPYGDLWGVVKQYRHPNGSREGFIPEPFLWSVFEGMVITGLLMEQGDVENPVKGWVPMVHRDLKATNFFMAENKTGIYPSYPIAKMGDFGITVFPRPPKTQYTFMVHCSYQPPELRNARLLARGQKMVPPATSLPPNTPGTEASAKTNVWGIGFTMWSLLSLYGYDPTYSKAGNNRGCFAEETTLNPIPLNDTGYSEALKSAIMQCVQYQPADRPTFQHLLEYIKAHTTPNYGPDYRDRSEGLRDNTAEPGIAEDFGLIYPEEDKYSLGGKVVDALWWTADRGPPPAPPRQPGAVAVDDTVLFGTPGRFYREEVGREQPGSKRKAGNGGAGGGPPAASKRRASGEQGKRPGTGDVSGRSSLEKAKGGAEGGGV